MPHTGSALNAAEGAASPGLKSLSSQFQRLFGSFSVLAMRMPVEGTDTLDVSYLDFHKPRWRILRAHHHAGYLVWPVGGAAEEMPP